MKKWLITLLASCFLWTACDDEDESKWLLDPTPYNLTITFGEKGEFPTGGTLPIFSTESKYIPILYGNVHEPSRTLATTLNPGEYYFYTGGPIEGYKKKEIHFEIIEKKETVIYVENNYKANITYKKL